MTGVRPRWARVPQSWITVTALAGLFVTCLDAALLQRAQELFTGGFLATDTLRGTGEVTAFLLASLVADISVIGVVVAIALWIGARLRLHTAARVVLAVIVGLAPLGIADFVSYRLASYLGDAFNLSLLMDLTGHSPAEILAVGYAHVVTPLLALASGGVIVVGIVWSIHTHWPRGAVTGPRFGAQTMLVPILFFLAGAWATGMARRADASLDNGLRRKPSGQVLGWFASTLTDVDRDGYGWLSRPADPNPWDARISPYAIDIPGNGVDEDGIGGDLPAGSTPLEQPRAAAPTWRSTPDVVLIVLESFRADMIGAAQDGAPVSPVLTKLAAQGVSAPYAYSHNGYTSQSRHHIFSGSVAGVEQGSLIDDFKANGYEVAYFSAQDESFGGPALAVGFERADVAYDARVEPNRRFSAFTTAGSLALPFSVLLDRIQMFLAGPAQTRPLFLYVNFQDTHFPYHHAGLQPLVSSTVVPQSDIAPARRDDVRAMYANTVANVDSAVGSVLDMVRRTRHVEPAVIVAADHGESLFDDGLLGHGVALNDTQTRIPLIVSNLPITIEEPFGQASLRDAIGAALEHAPTADRRPVLRENSSRTVFQYLGNFDRPAEIALTRIGGRTIYDFRSGLVQVQGSAAWRRPTDLRDSDRAYFQELVHTWERLRLSTMNDAVATR